MKNSNIVKLAIIGLITLASPYSYAMSDKGSLGLELGYAAHSGDLDAVIDLLEQGAEVNWNDEGSAETPLEQATANGHAHITSFLLLQKDIDPNKPSTERGTRPLWRAAFLGNATIVQQLLSAGANPNLTDCNGNAPLKAAALRGNVRIMQQLLSAHADPNSKDCDGTTPLVTIASGRAPSYEDSLKSMQLLLDAQAEINAVDKNGYTALHHAMFRDSLGFLIALLAHNANPTIKSIQNNGGNLGNETPLAFALRRKENTFIPILQNLPLTPEDIKYLSTALICLSKTALPKDIRLSLLKPLLFKHIAQEKMKKIEKQYVAADLTHAWNKINTIDRPMLKKALNISVARGFALPKL